MTGPAAFFAFSLKLHHAVRCDRTLVTLSLSVTQKPQTQTIMGWNTTQASTCISHELQVAAGAETAHARCPPHVWLNKCAQQNVQL